MNNNPSFNQRLFNTRAALDEHSESACGPRNSGWEPLTWKMDRKKFSNLKPVSWLDIKCINEQHPSAGLNLQHEL